MTPRLEGAQLGATAAVIEILFIASTHGTRRALYMYYMEHAICYALTFGKLTGAMGRSLVGGSDLPAREIAISRSDMHLKKPFSTWH